MATQLETPCIEYRGLLNRAGYARVPFGERAFDRRGRRKGRRRVMLHRWIVEQIEGVPLKPWPEEIVMHRCDNPPCFRYDHLVRATPTDNNRDAETKGRARKLHGDEHPNMKVTEAQVEEIREAASAGGVRYGRTVLAERFGVSESLITQIVGRTVRVPKGR